MTARAPARRARKCFGKTHIQNDSFRRRALFLPWADYNHPKANGERMMWRTGTGPYRSTRRIFSRHFLLQRADRALAREDVEVSARLKPRTSHSVGRRFFGEALIRVCQQRRRGSKIERCRGDRTFFDNF